MKIADDLLEALANAYRWVCGTNDVLIVENRVVTFEDFILDFIRSRERRGLPI
jgi:hypothetical protein